MSDLENFSFTKLLEQLKQDTAFAKANADGFEFFEILARDREDEDIIEVLRNFSKLSKHNIDPEIKHLDATQAVAFSIVEEKYYKDKLRGTFKFLDMKLWMYVGGLFAVEGVVEFGSDIPLKHLAAFALLLCAAGIIYDQYEKNIEIKILDQIKEVSNRTIELTPQELMKPPSVEVLQAVARLASESGRNRT